MAVIVWLINDRFYELGLSLNMKYAFPQYDTENLKEIELVVLSIISGLTTKLGMFSFISSTVKKGSLSNLVMNY